MRTTARRWQPLRIPTLSPSDFHAPAPVRSLQESIDVVTAFLLGSSQLDDRQQPPRRTLLLTGAGISVDSGIRAYRGEGGAYVVNKSHRPIFHGEFVTSERHRRRYWARSYLGYPPVRAAEPNAAHYACAALLKLGLAHSLITQNVDALHQKAWDVGDGSFERYINNVGDARQLLSLGQQQATAESSERAPPPPPPMLELHGTLRHAHCIKCNHTVSRDALQDELSELNPAWHEHSLQLERGDKTQAPDKLNPDGDVELGPGASYDQFKVPECDKCGGPMKPNVVFFGESLSDHTRDTATSLVDSSTDMIVVGSSLATYSAYRLVRQLKEQRAQTAGRVLLLNVGESRADKIADERVGWQGGASDILPLVARAALNRQQGANTTTATSDKNEARARADATRMCELGEKHVRLKPGQGRPA